MLSFYRLGIVLRYRLLGGEVPFDRPHAALRAGRPFSRTAVFPGNARLACDHVVVNERDTDATWRCPIASPPIPVRPRAAVITCLDPRWWRILSEPIPRTANQRFTPACEVGVDVCCSASAVLRNEIPQGEYRSAAGSPRCESG